MQKCHSQQAKHNESKTEIDAHILSIVRGAEPVLKQANVVVAIADASKAPATTPKFPAKLQSVMKRRKANVSATLASADFEANPHLDVDMSKLALMIPSIFPDACPDPSAMLEEEAEKKKRKRGPKSVVDSSTVYNVIEDKDGDKKPTAKKKGLKGSKKPMLTKIIEDPKEDKADEWGRPSSVDNENFSPHFYVSCLISNTTATISDTTHDDDDDSIGDGKSRTEPNSRANVAVVGKHCNVIANSGKTVRVHPFSPDHGSLENIHIVDAAIMWRCPHNDNPHNAECSPCTCHGEQPTPAILT